MPAESKSVWKRVVKFRSLYLIFLPIAAAYIIFCYIPLISGAVMSFQEFHIGVSIFNGKFNDFANYKAIFIDQTILRAIRNTLLISALKLVIGFFAPIILAIFIFDIRLRIYKRVCQTLL